MGFPIGYAEVTLPKFFIHTLTFLGFIRDLIIYFFSCLGLSDIVETDVIWPNNGPTRITEKGSVSARLIREILPVIKFQDLEMVDGDPPEDCTVCLYEFEGGEEIRCLRNCKHIFHRACLDRWMDHDQNTCPLCRSPFVSDEMLKEFNQRLSAAASGVDELQGEYGSVLVTGF